MIKVKQRAKYVLYIVRIKTVNPKQKNEDIFIKKQHCRFHKNTDVSVNIKYNA